MAEAPLEVSTGVEGSRVSVIIPAYLAGDLLPGALASLERQEFSEPYEVLVVNSGGQEFTHTPRRPDMTVRVLDFEKRLWPGAARNAGVRAARGEVIAFMPADASATPCWLAERDRAHAAGADLVGGSILNGRPRSTIATAEYLLEYSALLPIAKLLAEQDIPHAVSFKREVFDAVGLYPDDTATGEDTLFNRRCIQRGLVVAYAPRAALAHTGNSSLRRFARHAFNHGRGLMQCVDDHELPAALGGLEQPVPLAAARMLIAYPARGISAKVQRLRRFAPRRLPQLIMLSPLIAIGLIATGFGAFAEYMRRRVR